MGSASTALERWLVQQTCRQVGFPTGDGFLTFGGALAMLFAVLAARVSGIDRQEVIRMILNQGRIGLDEYLRCRVRYFSDGVAIGSRGFVDGVFGRFRGQFGQRRKTGARRMRDLEPELFTARDLRVDVFG